MPGQKYFIYSQNLGWYYEEKQLNKRIDRAVERRNETKSEARTRRFMNQDNRLKEFFDLSDGPQSIIWTQKGEKKKD